MIVFTRVYNSTQPVRVEQMHGNTFNGEDGAHQFIITGVPTGTVKAYMMRADGTTCTVDGTNANGSAIVTLNQDCYNVPGRFTLSVFVGDTGARVCVYACVGIVYRTRTETIIDSGDVVPSLDDVIDMYDDVRTAAAAAEAAAAIVDGTIESYQTGVNQSVGVMPLVFTRGAYPVPAIGETADISAPVVASSTSAYMCAKARFVPGQKITFKTGGGSSNYRVSGYYDANFKVVRRGATGAYEGTAEPDPTEYPDIAWVVINTRNIDDYYAYIGDSVPTELAKKQDALTFDAAPTPNSINPVTSGGIYAAIDAITETANERIEAIEDSIGYSDGSALQKTAQDGYYWNAEGETAVLTAYSNWTADTVDVSAGDSVHVHIRGEKSAKQWPVLVVDNTLTILAHYGERAQTAQDIYFVVPAGAAKLLLTHYTSTKNSAQVYPYELNSVVEMIAGIDSAADYIGCKLSLLGDSFSAFEGYSTGDHNYYPTSASDVDNVNQMWWKIVADYFGMTPLVIGAWSGSPVTAGVRSGYTPASDATRCEALDDGTNTPDVVLIAMGVNDYSYSESESQFGTWDGTTALGSETDLSDYDNTSFKTAYATMLARIQKKYPNAFIICITPWFQKRRTTDTGANYLNAIGKSIADYADAVREVCGIMHVACLDGTNIGFNRRNYYPTYCQDAAVSSTHPNIAGQAQIAKAIIAQMKTLHRLGS